MEFIKDFLKAITEIPLLIYLPIIFALLTYRKFKTSPKIVAVGAGILIILSIPLVPKFIAKPLFSLIPIAHEMGDADLIVVPTAGVLLDPTEKWQPSFMSMYRVVAGLKAQERFQLPLLVIGGNPRGESATEADTIIKAMGLENKGILIEKQAENSYETAQAIDRMTVKGKKVQSVILTTSKEHVLRMALSLLKAGIKVRAIPVATSREWEDFSAVNNYYPNLRGLILADLAIREYVGIFWYLVKGQIKFQDLFSR